MARHQEGQRWMRGSGAIVGACLVVGAAVMVHLPAQAQAAAQTIVLTPAADASIFSPTLGEGERADGQGDFLWVSTTAEGQARRMLLRFDLASVPAGREIVAARLVIYESRSRANHPVSVYRLLQAWSEGPSASAAGNGSPAVPGDVTWSVARFPDQPWIAPGGHRAAEASATVVVGLEGETYTWGSTAGLVADVQAWRSQPLANHGWILIGDEVTPRSAKRFESRESTPTARPRLEIELGPETAPAEGDVPLPLASLALLGVLLAAAVRRASRPARA